MTDARNASRTAHCHSQGLQQGSQKFDFLISTNPRLDMEKHSLDVCHCPRPSSIASGFEGGGPAGRYPLYFRSALVGKPPMPRGPAASDRVAEFWYPVTDAEVFNSMITSMTRAIADVDC